MVYTVLTVELDIGRAEDGSKHGLHGWEAGMTAATSPATRLCPPPSSTWRSKRSASRSRARDNDADAHSPEFHQSLPQSP